MPIADSVSKLYRRDRFGKYRVTTAYNRVIKITNGAVNVAAILPFVNMLFMFTVKPCTLQLKIPNFVDS